ncbi:unnamed protein product [Symbiodinium natans]|uniref:Uncharacterized protein n=1 Tax=Symbiodinium natans TaxID=878477 RepID=A0A812LLW4_9DINO|nr:unnamed protein product [Symbiodinium natans]
MACQEDGGIYAQVVEARVGVKEWLGSDGTSTSDVGGEEDASSFGESVFEEPIHMDAEVINKLSHPPEMSRELFEQATTMMKLLSEGPSRAAHVALRGPLASRQSPKPAWVCSIDLLVHPGPDTRADILVLRLSTLCNLKPCHIERMPKLSSARFKLVSWPGLSFHFTVEITCIDREDQFNRLMAAESAVLDLTTAARCMVAADQGMPAEATLDAYLLLAQAFAAQILPERAMTRPPRCL